VRLEERIPKDHPLQPIRALVNNALAPLNKRLEALYSTMGRPSIAPEMLLRAMLLQAFFSVRSERMLMERPADGRRGVASDGVHTQPRPAFDGGLITSRN